jgi:uncharacterized membrane protein
MSGENAAGRWIAWVLKFGSYSSALLMAAGLVLALFRPAAAVHYRLADLGHHLLRLDPTAVMQAGIAMLLATPVVRIVVAIIGFARERDYRYVWISSGVLLIVISSILFRAAH